MTHGFFRHYSNELKTEATKEILRVSGACGYALYYMIVEKLFTAFENRIEINDDFIIDLSDTAMLSRWKTDRIVYQLIGINALIEENGLISSPRVDQEIEKIESEIQRRRDIASKAGKASAKARSQKKTA